MKQASFPRQILQNIEDRIAFGSASPSYHTAKDRITLYTKYALRGLTSLFFMGEKSRQTKNIADTLQKFAADKDLTYFQHHREHWVYGEYQDYELVYHVDESQKKMSLTCTRLTPITSWYKKHKSLENGELLDKQVTVEDINQLFTNNLRNPLPGPIKFDASGAKLFHEEDNIWLGPTSLQQLFETLRNFANAYADCCAMVVAAGGETVTALEEIAINETHKLRSTAIQLLRDIAQETVMELSHQAPTLLCPRCLVRCTAYQVSLPPGDSMTYFGCRVCRRSRKFLNFKGQVVAVLDRHMAMEQSQAEDTLRVNWLLRRRLFDFEQVEIGQASDEEVERFAVQIGNDTDPIRRPRYKEICCIVSPNCNLSENTMRILSRMFGRVEVREVA